MRISDYETMDEIVRINSVLAFQVERVLLWIGHVTLFFLNGWSIIITSTVNVKSSVSSGEPETNKPQGYLSSKENPGKDVLRRPNIDDYTSGKLGKSGKSEGRRSSSWIVWGDVSDPWQTLGRNKGEEGTA